ncbi:MAG TPA: orotidine-5'-phosphate decarboxylase [Vicinamibacterales bacterium]
MKPLLVALDVDSAAEAASLAGTLRGVAGGIKIGSRLFTSAGPGLVEEFTSRGDRVFLDLKFHDIPNTVAGAVAAATRLGVWMLNVHASGGAAMMRAAREAANEEAARHSKPAPLVIAVTMLTSMNQQTLAEVGLRDAVDDQVARLAVLARDSGMDGVVSSPREIAIIRRHCGNDFAIVTPGIRGGAAGAPDVRGEEAPGVKVRGEGAPGVKVRGDGAPGVKEDDQSRTLTAAEALAAGATYIVVGRPIIAERDPRAAAERIAAECRAHVS